MIDTSHGNHKQPVVDNTDWLKTAAIVLVAVDHFGYFFVDEADWWSVFGRLAAPVFFYLIGYAQTRTVPSRWIWLGVFLTLLESWNAGWTWVAPNILLSFALIRAARPFGQMFLRQRGWVALGAIVCALLVLLPMAGQIADYGAEGWLWALFGLCQRMYVDGLSGHLEDGRKLELHDWPRNANLMRLASCLIAVTIYIWQEQREYDFLAVHFTVFVVGVCGLALILVLFRRGGCPIQPEEPFAGTLRFIGRNTLEIYVIQLAGSELLIKLLPDLAA